MGRTVNYQNAEHLILSWELGDHDLAIEHDDGTWHIPTEKAEGVVFAWEGQLQRQTSAVTLPATSLVAAPSSTLHDVNELLLDSMKRVRDDPGYASQAKVIADTAQVVINSAKVQVEAAKIMVQGQRGK